MTDAAAPDLAELSFEAALRELETIVAKLEAGEVALEESIDLYQRGAALKAHCQARLDQARLRVESLIVGPDGQATRAEPAEFQ